jgi:hypothetical protein
MHLPDVDVRGEAKYDDDTEEVLDRGDPSRSLVRYRDDGPEVFVSVRLNLPLLAAAAALPVVVLEPQSRPEEIFAADGLLKVDGSRRNYAFFEQVLEDVVARGCRAAFLAELHGRGRRDFFLAAEDAAALEAIARGAAAATGFPLTVREVCLADVAPTILPTELIGELGLEVPATERTRRTRFEFWGAGPSLEHLRGELERRDYTFVSVEIDTSELRMVKEVPIDGPGFLAVLREIVPLARDLRCSYRGTETVGGFDQFALANPLPDHYVDRGAVHAKRRWFFGRSY